MKVLIRRLFAGLAIASLAIVGLTLAHERSWTSATPGGERGLVPRMVPVALAACGVASPCLNESTRGLGVLTVRHDMGGMTVGKVRVDDTAETWDVTAHWQTSSGAPYCSCEGSDSTVSVDVDWDSVNNVWTSACAGCDAVNGPIYAVTVCKVSDCGGQISKPYAYRLIVQMDRARVFECYPANQLAHLNRVEFESTDLSDGIAYSGLDCLLTLTAVTPIYSSYSTNDPGDWECDFNCANARGPEIAITYQ